jgi:hypothetical protein
VLHAIKMAVFLHHNEFSVEVFDDATFTRSVESPTSYDIVIQDEKDKAYSPKLSTCHQSL